MLPQVTICLQQTVFIRDLTAPSCGLANDAISRDSRTQHCMAAERADVYVQEQSLKEADEVVISPEKKHNYDDMLR